MSFLLSNYPDWLDEKLAVLNTRLVDAEATSTQRLELLNESLLAMRMARWSTVGVKGRATMDRCIRKIERELADAVGVME